MRSRCNIWGIHKTPTCHSKAFWNVVFFDPGLRFCYRKSNFFAIIVGLDGIKVKLLGGTQQYALTNADFSS
jgi:hypothetical protein